MTEVTETMRQRSDTQLTDTLSKIRVGDVDGVVEKKLKSRITTQLETLHSANPLHLFAENAPGSAQDKCLIDQLDKECIQFRSLAFCYKESVEILNYVNMESI